MVAATPRAGLTQTSPHINMNKCIYIYGAMMGLCSKKIHPTAVKRFKEHFITLIKMNKRGHIEFKI